MKSLYYLTLAGLTYTFLPRFAGDHETEGSTDAIFEPTYLKLHKNGELNRRGQELWDMMASCKICPRQCGVNRLAGKEGFCHASAQLEISSFQPHFGEERPLVGRGGGGQRRLYRHGGRTRAPDALGGGAGALEMNWVEVQSIKRRGILRSPRGSFVPE